MSKKTTSIGLMRQLAGRLNLLRGAAADQTTRKLRQAGFHSRDAAVVFVFLVAGVARLLLLRARLGAAESAALTMTVTPSLLRLRKMLEAFDTGMSASSNARRTSSASR